VMWPTTSGRLSSFSVTGRGQKGKLPPVEPLDRVTGARELVVRANSVARPSHPRTRPRHWPVGAVWRDVGKMVEEEEVRLTSRSHTSVRERKSKRAPAGWAAVFSGLMGLVGPDGLT
jgi:hypothetical protein